jgi:hypothetical protein
VAALFLTWRTFLHLERYLPVQLPNAHGALGVKESLAELYGVLGGRPPSREQTRSDRR